MWDEIPNGNNKKLGKSTKFLNASGGQLNKLESTVLSAQSRVYVDIWRISHVIPFGLHFLQ